MATTPYHLGLLMIKFAIIIIVVIVIVIVILIIIIMQKNPGRPIQFLGKSIHAPALFALNHATAVYNAMQCDAMQVAVTVVQLLFVCFI